MIDVDIVGQLLPNWLTMAVQLCSTLLLFLVAKHFLWASVKNFLGKRSQRMQENLEASNQAKQSAEADRTQAREQLAAASGKAEEIVSAAVKEAKTQKESILKEADREAELARAKARDQIEAERREMYNSVQNEIVEVAMSAAAKLMENQDGVNLDRQAVDSFVKEASSHGK